MAKRKTKSARAPRRVRTAKKFKIELFRKDGNGNKLENIPVETHRGLSGYAAKTFAEAHAREFFVEQTTE